MAVSPCLRTRSPASLGAMTGRWKRILVTAVVVGMLLKPAPAQAHAGSYTLPCDGLGCVALVAIVLVPPTFLATVDGYLGSGERVGPTYTVIETVVSAMQVGFGVTTMACADPGDRWMVTGFTLLPTSLFPHGALSLIDPESRDEHGESASESQRPLTRKGGLEDVQWGTRGAPAHHPERHER